MSYGWVAKKSEQVLLLLLLPPHRHHYRHQGSAVMRGPRSSAVATQMLTLTDWCDLDYLIIDMPPGMCRNSNFKTLNPVLVCH
jgi:Mrp family chromosome partitioning ATPase